MAITRRQLFSGIAKAGVPTAIAVTVGTGVLHAEEKIPVPNAAVGLLYDASICIGCKSCVAACAEANGTPPDTRGDGLHQAPSDLNDLTRNVIKLYKEENSPVFSFVKRQCMHCLDPACAAGCPFQALHKDTETGIASWTEEACIGCRYCTITCPYHIPRFQWKGFNPRVTKCELCGPRLEQGLKPGCTTVCPTGAVIFGPRSVLLLEAKQRIEKKPGALLPEPRLRRDGQRGDAGALYLSRVAFEKLGLPELGTGVSPGQDVALAEALLSVLCVAGRPLRRASSGNSQESERP